MAIKLLVNGVAGYGKTDLLRTLDPKTTLVISRDAKDFSLPIPHMLVDTWYGMDALISGIDIKEEDGTVTHVDGIMDKMEAFNNTFNNYPETVVIDSVSQIFMDVIDIASQTPNVYGSQGAEVTKEMALLTQFIHEQLELNGINVIMLNHVIEEKAEGVNTGKYIQFGSGKFLSKGGFYSIVNESVTLAMEGNHRVIYTRSPDKQARTSLVDIPDKMFVANTVHPDKSKKLKEGEEYFSLQTHLDKLLKVQSVNKRWSI